MALQDLTVRSALAALEAREFTPTEYISELLDWQARWRQLNVYTAQDVPALRAASRQADLRQRQLGADAAGSLNGLPIAVKDNIDCVGYCTSGGTPGLKDHRPNFTAPLLQRLLDQGALVTGKTGLHELAAGGTCANLVFGSVRNPYNLIMVPGGSSGGSAAAVAARLVPAALGTDTAGSVRAPASHCGCVGFRPTTGRYDSTGMVPGSSRIDTMGWLARTVEDIQFLDRLSGTTPAPVAITTLRGVRLGVPRRYFYDSLHPSVAAVVERALELLSRAGAQLIEVEVPDIKASTQGIINAIRPEFHSDLGAYLSRGGTSITVAEVTAAVADPVLREAFSHLLGAGQHLTPAAREELTRALQAFKEMYQRVFVSSKCVAFVVPTCPDPPYPIPADPALGGPGPMSMIRNTEPGSLAALPSLSVPAGLTADGLPVGIQFDGPSGTDATVLAIGRLFEALVPALPAPTPPI
jgi:indoleacetamide hydrolase